MYLQRLRIILESERGHRIQDILAPDRLALLHLTLVGRLGGDEADELGNTLLHALFGLFGDLRGGRDGGLHYSRDVRDLCMYVCVYIWGG